MRDQVRDGRHLLTSEVTYREWSHAIGQRKRDALLTQAECHGSDTIIYMNHLIHGSNMDLTLCEAQIQLVIAARAAFHFARLFVIYSNGGI